MGAAVLLFVKDVNEQADMLARVLLPVLNQLFPCLRILLT